MSAPAALQARSLDRRAGAALRPGARPRVHSLFERACNLLDDHGRLLTLVGPAGGNGPATVVLASLPPGGFRRLGLPIGQTASVSPREILSIGPLAVNLAGATLWQPPLGPPPGAAGSGSLAEPALCRRLARAAARGAERGPAGLGGLLPHLGRLLAASPAAPTPPVDGMLLERAAWTRLVGLLAAWRARSAAEVERAAAHLVGLGPGQTPSGDDLLAGFVVARARRAPGELALARAVLAAAEGRTSDLGHARLGYAAEGELDERSELALAALLAGDDGRVERATRQLLGFGHSSGLDTLVGLLLGLGLAIDDPPPEWRPAPRLGRPG